jgi:hypothetical protein
MWDFFGAWDPTGRANQHLTETFSIGCFQWVPTANGKDLKRGKVMWRVKGRVEDARAVREKADEYCARMNKLDALDSGRR